MCIRDRYFIAAHPGTTDKDMLNLALWLKERNFRLDQVQTFLPTPMAIATAMYHTQHNPLKKITRDTQSAETVETVPVSYTHLALGKMPLQVTLLDADGREIDRRCTSADGGY